MSLATHSFARPYPVERIEGHPGPRIVFAAGVWSLFLAGSIRTISYFTGDFVDVRVSYLSALGIGLIGIATVVSLPGRQLGLTAFRPAYRGWVAALMVASLGMAFLGVIKENPILYIALEGLTVASFLLGILWGARPQSWKTIEPAYLYGFLLIALPIIMWGLLGSPGWNPRVLRFQPVYQAQHLLMPAAFFVLLAGIRWKRLYAIGGVAFLVYALLQVLLEKRAPLLRILFFAALVLVVHYVGGVARSRNRKQASMYLPAVVMAAFLAGVLTILLLVRFTNIEDRFALLVPMLDQFSEFVLNPLEARDEQAFRLLEVGVIHSNMDTLERLFGVGLGGFVYDPVFLSWSIDVEGQPVAGVRGSVHIGLFWAYFKGGVLYWLIYYSGIIALLLSYRRFRKDALSLACWAFLLGMVLFQVMEGHWMLQSLELTALLVGACIGRLAGWLPGEQEGQRFSAQPASPRSP